MRLRALAPLALALLAGCAAEYPQSSIDPRSDFAESIHSLYVLIFWITLAILTVVWVALAYVVVRFRARENAPLPRQIHGHLGLEIAWTVVPAIIVVVIAIPSIQTVFRTQRPISEDAMVVEVIGHQFWWEFRYPDASVITANELHLPVGRPVSLRMHSADVIHSFWVPQLGGKRDVNPLVARPEGEEPHYNWLYFTANEPGVYMGQCAEFCGQSHSLMGMRVVVESEEEFAAWLEDWRGPAAPADGGAAADTSAAGSPVDDEAREQQAAAAALAAQAPADSAATGADSALVAGAGASGGGGSARIELGRQTFASSTCVACHAIQGTPAAGRVGPDLTLMGRRSTIAAGWLENTPENLVRWITAPRDIKPAALMPGVSEPGGNFPATNLSEEQVLAVAEYLWSLGRTPGEGR